MAWASVGRAGSTGGASLPTTQSFITITLNGQAGTGANVGDVLVVANSINMDSSVAIGSELISIIDSASNNYIRANKTETVNAAQVADVVNYVYYAHIEKALTTSNTLTINYSNNPSVQGHATVVWRFSKGAGSSVRLYDTTFNTVSSSSVAGTLDIAGPATETLRLRTIAAFTTLTSITTSAGWTSIGTTRGGANLEPAVYGEFRIVSASTAASSLTNASSNAKASVYAIFEENSLTGDGIF